jgi:hypothetical protein
MKAFAGIDIDPKFIDGTYKYLQDSDLDGNGVSVDELIKVVVPS